jgi:D-glycero-D-manno-heptose 1,7-bisphosphate phosphatase
MRKAIFFDRDGVLNFDHGDYVTCLEDFKILDGVGEALHHWKSEGWMFFVITNQAGINKGLYTHADLHSFHKVLVDFLQTFDVEITEYYYSPYHPDYCNSINRKPDSLLIERAIAKYHIEAASSWMIGDRDRDIEAAEKAGVRAIKVAVNDDLRKLIGTIC